MGRSPITHYGDPCRYGQSYKQVQLGVRMKNLIVLSVAVIQTSAIRFFIHTSKKRKKVTSILIINGGLSEWPLTGKTGDFGAKNKKETYIFFKTGVFRSGQSEKWNTELYIFGKGGLLERPR